MGCASSGPYSYTFQKEQKFLERPGKSLKVDVYRPARPLSPAVIVVHGGSWTSRTGDMESICIRLAKNGFTAFNVTYRLAPENLYPKAVEDVVDAFAWVRSRADEYKIDPEQIYVWGYSAGGHLALMAGLDPKTRAKGIVAGGAPTDLTIFPGSPVTARFLGKSYAENPELWAEASPLHHLTASSPPIFMYHGAWDNKVEPIHVTRLEEKAQSLGVRFEKYIAPLQGHIFVYLFSRESVNRGLSFLQDLAGKTP